MDTLQHICEDFRRKIELAHEKGAFVDDVTFKHFPKGCCGLTCYLLSEYLLEYKAKTIYVWGTYSGQSHAWLVLKDKRVATPTQKYNLMPDSYKTFLQSYGQEVYDEPFVTINYKYEDIKDGLIIDITADQFGQSPVYLGPLVLYPIRCKTLLDGGRRRTKNLYGVFKRTVPAGQVRQ